ncbi:hypothetical protein [Saccharopolyspora elongata]|uniref:Uncharacterized protein n=1 Tax=Saccharopolyspora elongata TaxID=2530387 RepID=A0A4V2YJV5_9PSEU|nr:hypothetical protein [Saccharopolyspora elongata]TDD40277.1 hypothetical protein E1288_35700 [Saccharopolyspora elongata]
MFNLFIYLRADRIAPCQAAWWWVVVAHSIASVVLAVAIQLFQVNWLRIVLAAMGIVSVFLAIYAGLHAATLEMILQMVLVGSVPWLFNLDRGSVKSPDRPGVDAAEEAMSHEGAQ